MEQQNILVTGASGLIGRPVYEKLITLGYSVTGVDNFSRPGGVGKADIINCDLSKFYQNTKNNFNIIFHLAAINGTSNFYSRPNRVIENNIESDLATFNFAKCNNSKVVYASSSEVVAGSDTFPTVEETDIYIKNIHNPRWSYRLSKIISENYLTNSDLNYLIVRFFNVFGSNSREGHFLYDICKKINKEDYSLIGYNETRSFCYIDDAVDALLYVAFNQSGSVINIGNDEEISILEAANIISKVIYNKEINWDLQEGKQGSAARRCPSLENLRSKYKNFSPREFKKAIEEISNEICR